MKKILTVVASILLALVLVACGENSGDNSKREKVTISQTITVTVGTNEKGEAITEKQKVDQEMYTNATRVASFSYGAADMLYIAGLKEAGIETLGIAKGTGVPALINQFNSNDYPNIGTLFEENLDALTLLNPQLILLDGRSSGLYSKLKTEFPSADILDVSNTTYSLDKQNEVVEILGKLFPKVKSALDSRMAQINANFEGIAEVAKNYNALFLMSNGKSFSVSGKTGRYGALHIEFGFKEADLDGKVGDAHGNTISFEYLEKVNPELIFVMDRAEAVGSESGLEDLLNEPQFKKLKVAVDGNVYKLDSDAWYLVTGGFSSTEQMVKDILVFINKVK